ncbi:MAG: shikimate kinase [Campylobacteraceae bacterium]|nr:shikimate kinase [Campylobacteraceae bacterium]
MKKKNNIVLIGFMGAGKGTVARALYTELGLFPIDCDDMIESAANKKIKDIFADDGEAKFREMEADLAKFLFDNVDNSVISTGGGFYKTPNLNKLGTIIYLKAEFDYIIDRIKSSPNAEKKFAKRPLLANLDEARKLHNERDEKYAKKADFIVDVANKKPKEIAKEIKKLIKGK